MKLNRILMACGMAAALCLSATSLLAQDNGGDGGGGQGRRGRGNGGGGPGGGPGGGNFDPAQFQQRMMDNVKTRLGFTNETDWSAVQPLVQKVMDTQREARSGGGGMFRRRGGDTTNTDQGGQRRGPELSAEAEALQKAIDSNAPSAQIKAALEKYRASRKDKEAKLAAAQEDLRKVLTTKQEAEAVLMNLLN
jgi:hypothetical protein